MIIGTSFPTMHSVWRHHVHSVAAVLVLYSVISVSYFNYLMMASETPRICEMFGCKFIPGAKKCYYSFPKDAILTNKCLKKCRRSDGINHGLKNNTRFTRFFNPTKKKNILWRNWQLANGGISVLCLTISRNAFVSRCIWLKLSSIWSK